MKKEEIYRILGEAYFSDHPDENDALPAFARLLSGAKFFVDVGASLGQFTRLASRTIRGGEILAVEADPVRFEELERNCARWAAESGNRIRAVHAAVTDVEGVVKFQTTNSNVSGGLTRHSLDHLPRDVAVEWQEVEVEAKTLDGLCDGRAPDLIKMDIEGAELAALRGAGNRLREHKTRLVVEVHTFPELGGTKNLEAVSRLMADYGYEGLPFYGKVLYGPAGSFGWAEKMQWHGRRWARALKRRLRPG